jgi:hypothetical protein
VTKTCKDILSEAANHSLKAVELANTLRARVGTDVLAQVRERWGGLLSLLEKLPGIFLVERIPKNDLVSLVGSRPLASAAGSVNSNSTTSVASLNSVGSNNLSTDLHSDAAAFYPSSTRPRMQQQTQQSAHTMAGDLSSSMPSVKYQNKQQALLQQQRAYVIPNADRGGNVGVPSMASPAGAGNMMLNAGPTRCLHIGNVPTSFTEYQLRVEFQQFGDIENIKLINQRVRRFAFITFKRIESAIAAKQNLNWLGLWKNSISFAHKEGYLSMMQQQQQMSSGYDDQDQTAAMLYDAYQQYVAANGNGSSASDPASAGLLQMLGSENSSVFESDTSVLDTSIRTNSGLSNTDTDSSRGAIVAAGGYAGASGSGIISPAPSAAANLSAGILRPGSGLGNTNHFANPRLVSPAGSPALPAGGVSMMDPVLRRLCDDTYVPTQAWPIDPLADQPYTTAVVLQLRQFGGTITISKLRGFLRNRLNAVDNIKSVPLKAMLAAYPQLFFVNGSQVSLAHHHQLTGQGSNGPQNSSMSYQREQHQQHQQHQQQQQHQQLQQQQHQRLLQQFLGNNDGSANIYQG